MRDIIPTGTLGPGTSYDFMRETAGEGENCTYCRRTLKPPFDLRAEEASVKVETIAGFAPVTRKAMNNVPGFVSWLQSRLPELFLRAEDKQILFGTGVSPQIKGIMTSGNYTPAVLSSDTDADVLAERIIDGIAQLEDSDDDNAVERIATAILLRPKHYYSFFKNKASGSGEYNLPQNVTFANGVLYISGVPVYASTAMSKDANGDPMNKYIVGDSKWVHSY
jgi:HK97 family phage major capsid protein